jgi:succinate dehydrogenase/fumarate reductase flavoprotein subunit
MTKMGIRTGADCRSDAPGLLAAGLAQAGCANHRAGFHTGPCGGNGWIAGGSAIEDLDGLGSTALDGGEVNALHAETLAPLKPAASAESDRILRDLQAVMFAYDTGILKREDRLKAAFERVAALDEQFCDIAAPHTHELVRLKETEAMLLAARFILGASLYRTESRLSHFREDFDARDDTNWLVWVDVSEGGNGPAFSKTPIPTPFCSVTLPRRKPSRLAARQPVAGT